MVLGRYSNMLVVAVVVVMSLSSVAMIGAAAEQEARKLFSLESIFNPRVSVKIVNKLGTWDTLTVHCKSKNDDIGIHPIVANGSYTFSFHPSIWENTLFHCSMEWPGNLKSFDIYQDWRDNHYCEQHCCWFIMPKGPMRCDNPILVFPWND